MTEIQIKSHSEQGLQGWEKKNSLFFQGEISSRSGISVGVFLGKERETAIGEVKWFRTLPITIGDPKIAIVITKKKEEKIMLLLIRRANVEVYYPHSWLGNI